MIKVKQIIKKLYILLISIFIGMNSIYAAENIITINKGTIVVGPGYSETIRYTLLPGLNSSNIIWKSANPNIATVDANGKVTGLTIGQTIITAHINGASSTCTIIVSNDYVPVKGISINRTNLNILLNSSESLNATIYPSNATNKDVVWTSSNPSIASVDSTGKVTARKIGSTIITASTSGYSATAIVNVVDSIPLKGITINKSNITIKEQASETLQINYNPSNATNKKITWKSSNNNIVKVDSNGKITGITAGSATITAISNDGGYVATCKVTVESLSKNVTGVSLNKKELSLVAGKEEKLIVTIAPSYAGNKNVKWETSDKSVATVKDGVVTANKKGTAEIKVISEDGQKEAICKVTVTSPPVESISFKNEKQTVYLDSKTTLKPVTTPTNSELENPIWKSSNEEVAVVEDGIVTALSIGETVITISNQDESISATTIIKVVNKPKETLKISIDGYNLNFSPDIKNYTLKIGSESELKIHTNLSEDKVTINGNQKLKNGSIITITINDSEKVTYVINIKKQENYTIYFIAIISVLLLLNLIRLLFKKKKK